ncbi:mucin-binding protein [Secundilactobacillus folii]|uniref:LPXTG cell wall anchor domain-containing protein n=1 Tax=Secundilactobacillus folii TaxID=2678357 RepID=A0A7X2XU36_9LACO|nr:KxYKxGKxW signal peptide domain-containing protein [Secundilactobacillus folii]MTV81679.1 LPXTG cell wall anchor domain-containing protein [Secundilactobacillus folii]
MSRLNQRVMENQNREIHYKLYKSGKQWLVAGIITATLGLSGFSISASADTTTTNGNNDTTDEPQNESSTLQTAKQTQTATLRSSTSKQTSVSEPTSTSGTSSQTTVSSSSMGTGTASEKDSSAVGVKVASNVSTQGTVTAKSSASLVATAETKSVKNDSINNADETALSTQNKSVDTTNLGDAAASKINATQEALAKQYQTTKQAQKLTAVSPIAQPLTLTGSTITSNDVEQTDGLIPAGSTVDGVAVTADTWLKGTISVRYSFYLMNSEGQVVSDSSVPNMSMTNGLPTYYLTTPDASETFYRTATIQNGQLILSDWETSGGIKASDYVYPDVTSFPDVPGYTLTASNTIPYPYDVTGASIQPSTVDELGDQYTQNNDLFEDTFEYVPSQENLIVNYIDRTTGQMIHSDTITDKGGTAVTWFTPEQEIQQLENAGYQLVSNNYPAQTVVLDMDPSVDQVYTVYLKPTMTRSQSATTRTITFVSDDSTAPLPATVVQVVKYNVFTNAVTGQSIYVPAAGTNLYNAYTTPTLAGYSASPTSVPSETFGLSTTAPMSETFIVRYEKNTPANNVRSNTGNSPTGNTTDGTSTNNNVEGTTVDGNNTNSSGGGTSTTTNGGLTINNPGGVTNGGTTVGKGSNISNAGNINGQTTHTSKGSVVSSPIQGSVNNSNGASIDEQSKNLSSIDNNRVVNSERQLRASSLPQTNESNSSFVAVVGLSLLASLLSLFSAKRKRRE